MITIPLLGRMTAQVGLAPFQFNPPDNNHGLPVFDSVCPGDVAAGFYGLRAIYSSISPWKGNGTYVDEAVQLSHAAINSYGIFNYDQSLANVAQYNPVLNTYPGYKSSYRGISTFFSRYNLTDQASEASGPWLVYRSKYPTVIYENITSSFKYDYKASMLYPFSVSGIGYILQCPGFAITTDFNDMVFAPTLQGFTGSNAGIPAILPGMYAAMNVIEDRVYVPGIGGKSTLFTWGNYPIAVNKDGLNAIAVGFTGAVGATQGFYNASVNPATGNFIANLSELTAPNPPYDMTQAQVGFNVGGVYYNATINLGSYVGKAPIYAAQLSDAGDNAALTGAAGVPEYTSVMTPFGDFLLKVSSLEYYLLIKGDFSGYYRITFQGNSTAAGNAIRSGGLPVGFGMDLNGNVWFGGASAFVPLLYSTLGLGWSLAFNGFPTVTSNAVYCRNDGFIDFEPWKG